MYSSVELDKISDQIVSMSLPEVVYGNSRMYIVNREKDFLYEINGVDSLKLISFDQIKKSFTGNSDDILAKMDSMTL
jgi:hypothetical protein